ncbi:aldo/keto reductase [Pseudomonas lijiangensis]|uniref:Aldo/keto reductase n=1 Tax=Pseudomonas lijiangensis TaxID=2995658 RepID=A0ABX8I184_9PSED|nr:MULTISPECIES: aldo/keto reductase [Pseudomonas syringae group]MBX8499198.1 aldo/keto reductase [Pseudomonas lijiangensis]MBX8504777.1 aldo/keto reductase [Pseudomonas lijiangensis]MBX8548663.1 aldo/keto reductase [Pseudomonas cichorii]MBX8559673.1 aldo/keto reductase [Pseudomonas cichorii]MBX8569323.1 aldo/keto reductase [Pseudomonas cichorii]
MVKQQLTIQLSDAQRIPQIGLGVWQASDDEARAAVRVAIEEGYCHVDTASIYGNEKGVGEGLRDSGAPREQVFLTTKVWNNAHGFDAATAALDASLKRLKVDYVDLLLIHWPVPSQNDYVDTWRALIEAQRIGKAKSIGVSNFNRDHLQRLTEETGVAPVLNQIELHPFLQQRELRDVHESMGIATQSWSPLGQGSALSNPAISEIARKHGRTAAQVIIRWHIELGLIAIPKSITPSRIYENFNVFDFSLDTSDLAAFAALDSGKRLGPDPSTFA